MAELIDTGDITALILAGGRGSRMGGVDKGLQTFKGTPMVEHALRRLQLGAGVGHIAINANRNLPSYESFGVPVWPDGLAGHAGPLAGFLVGLQRCTTPFLMTVPCDTPGIPMDLAKRLADALERDSAEIAMVAAMEVDDQGEAQLRPQPVFCLLRVALLASLQAFTDAGGRKVDAWTALHNPAIVPFNLPGDDLRAFRNANSLAELEQLEQT